MASVNILTDIFILVMPMRAFGQLKLQRTKRFALLGVFMVGGVAVIASIVRLYALYVYAVTDDPPYDDVFVSTEEVETLTVHNEANAATDPLALANRSERSHHISFRPSAPTSSYQSLHILIPRLIRPVPSFLRDWRAKLKNAQPCRSNTFKGTYGAVFVQWNQKD